VIGAGSPHAGRTGGSRSRFSAGRSARCARCSAASWETNRCGLQPRRRSPANLNTYVSRLRRTLAAVIVRQADDVVEIRGRDLDDQRVLERAHAVHRARCEVERVACADFLLLELLPDAAELERGAPFLDVPRLVLPLVVLERQGMPGADEEELARVPVALGPDQLPAPRLL